MAGTTTASHPTGLAGSDVRDVIIQHNLLVDDAELIRGGIDEGITLLRELHDDHATFKTAADAVETLVEELHDDHATNKTLLDEALFKLAYLIHWIHNRSVDGTSPVFAISSNFDVANTETVAFLAAGVPYTLADNTVCDTGTAKTLTASQWGAFVIDATNATTLTATWAAGGFASEALALAAAKAIPFVANQARLGIVTVQAHASGFTAGTDALATGAGGNVAAATNYYQFFDLVALTGTTTAATLTAAKPASAPATLAATKPTLTTVDEAGDLLAAKVGDQSGTAITA